MDNQTIKVSKLTAQDRVINIEFNHVRRVNNTTFRRRAANQVLRPDNSSGIEPHNLSNLFRYKPNFNRARQGTSRVGNRLGLVRQIIQAKNEPRALLNGNLKRLSDQVGIRAIVIIRSKGRGVRFARVNGSGVSSQI